MLCAIQPQSMYVHTMHNPYLFSLRNMCFYFYFVSFFSMTTLTTSQRRRKKRIIWCEREYPNKRTMFMHFKWNHLGWLSIQASLCYARCIFASTSLKYTFYTFQLDTWTGMDFLFIYLYVYGKTSLLSTMETVCRVCASACNSI